MPRKVFGIDLGTTYSCIAYVDETGRAVVIKNLDGTDTTPSVVNFASPTEVVVGQVAKDNAVIDTHNTSSLVKTLIGKSDVAGSYNGEDKSPEEVSAYILRKVTSDASSMIGSEVMDVVITCPAYFGAAERTATKNAGIIAGLNVLEIISEPTAAALYYGCTKEHDDKTVLVYDLGGGTFDVTIMNISSDKIKVVCSVGNPELGGKDWDEVLMRYLNDEFVKVTSFTGDFDEFDQQHLRSRTEKAKQDLSRKPDTFVILEMAKERAKINLSRDKFNDLTSVLLNETIEKTDEAIAVAKSKGYDEINEILLVGGSTFMPQITDALKQKYGMEPKLLEPNEAVAKGAAIHAVNVYINNQRSLQDWEDQNTDSDDDPTLPPPSINPDDYRENLDVDVTSMSIGGRMREVEWATTKSYALEVLVGAKKEPKCHNLIIKNESMPGGTASSTGRFRTEEDDQEFLDIKVYENDFMETYFDVDKDYLLGSALFDLPRKLPQGAPLEITFSLNNEGILEITGRDLTNNCDLNSEGKGYATMQAKGIMSTAKVNELKEKSRGISVS